MGHETDRGQMVMRLVESRPGSPNEEIVTWYADDVTRVVAYNRRTLEALDLVKEPDEFVWAAPEVHFWVDEVLVYVNESEGRFARHEIQAWADVRLTIDMRDNEPKNSIGRIDWIKG